MADIETRALSAIPTYHTGCDRWQSGYVQGALDQKQIDIEKLKDIMNRLMLDTKDKAEIIKAMEE